MSDKRRNFRITFTVATVILVAIAVFLISVVSNIPGARVDLTSDRLFTLSPAAATVLKDLQVSVQVKLYITPAEKMPTELRNLERDITEQLRNFERVSGGMLRYSVSNPQDDEEMQDDLVSKGIRPYQVQSVDKDEIGVKLIWSALTIAYKDYPAEVIPRILPQTMANFENAVIAPVARMTREKAPKIAVFAPLKPVDQQLAMMYMQQGMQPPEPQDLYTQIQQLLEQEHNEVVRIQLTRDSGIPEDADVLLVLGPLNLNERQVWEINRALSNGMPTVLAVQAHEYNYSPGARGGWTIGGQEQVSGIDDLLATFGLSIAKDHFMDASLQVLELPREVNMGGLRMQTREPVRTPLQILVTEDGMNQESLLTRRIGALLYLWGTPIDIDAVVLGEAGLQATVLMSSSDNSWRQDFSPGPVTADMFDPRGKQMLGPQPLAILVDGLFPDSFAETTLPTWPEQTPLAVEGEDPASATDEGPDFAPPLIPQPSQLMLLGCAKMFDDNILQGAQNALLLLNAVDFLSGSENLLSIRAKTLTQRVIKPTPASQKIAWRIFAVFVVPVVLAAFGFIRAGMRRKEAARYRQQLLHTGSGRF